ncbi:Ig-like domain-containing protein [Photobacterium phosphoreum]|uniref:Ig-like domain-containing protein n=1 Tax=Photobacterium phosphoreum TaxID=659 RepID=UPI000D1618A7|nr:hypothetical protein [Photobacterium phosphoreum]PSU73497.1 hypothetical protein CTM67_19795 [Photobacterium phosphoreum]
MFHIKKYFIFSLLSLVILGCGNESDNNEGPSPQEKIAINAQDLLSFSPTKNTQVIDLRQRVTAENNQDLIIEDVESIDNNCAFNKKDINGLTFKVTTNSAGVCRFKYHVKPQSSKYTGTSDAIAQIVVTEDYTKGDFLPPVSRTITESTSLYLDKKDLLIESGFEIDPTSVYLTGETTSLDIGSFAADESSITYLAPSDTTGTVRIFYTEIDSINNIARPGVVYIAIGQKGNHNPVALDQQLEPLSFTNGPITIDISDYISDQDEGDILQLIDAKSFLGTIKIDSEHSFTYTPRLNGTEVLTYIISDHNGGYGIGTLSFTITPYETILDEKQKILFTPPLIMSQLSETNGIYTDVYSEIGTTGVTGIYPTFDKVLAEAYCTTKGMTIASLAALQTMRTNVLDDKPIFSTKYLWHSGKPFLTLDNDAISLDTGKIAPSTGGYFSCTDTLLPRTWNFVSKYYSAKYDAPTAVYLSSKTTSGGSVFLSKEKYNLNYTVESMNVNGTLIDPSRADEFITVNIIGNNINVKKVNDIDFAVNVTLAISDPITTSTTKIILGITICPLDIANPPEADRLGCILPLHGKNNELFTLALSNNLLQTMGIGPDLYDQTGDRSVGNGISEFRGITWQSTAVEHKTKWLNVMNQACNAMNELKLAGRTNWTTGADNLPNKLTLKYFILNNDEAKVAFSYVEWLHVIDHGKFGGMAAYGQGYVSADPNHSFVVNQDEAKSDFAAQGKEYAPTTISFVSCWSKN